MSQPRSEGTDRWLDPRAYLVLADREPVFARLITRYGHPSPFDRRDGGRTDSSQFAAMVLHIVGQQISITAAAHIYDRIAAESMGVPTAESMLDLGVSGLRAAGLSAAKASYVLALAQAQAGGAIDIEAMADLDDQTIIDVLTSIRGIGLWSAQIFLIRNLARHDILPAGDLGIRRAVARQWQLAATPSPAQVSTRGLAWAPYRSYAAALLWRSLKPADAESGVTADRVHEHG